MDVAGYSALMERAEEATYAEFERFKRELIEPSLSRHEGRLIKTTGDGALVEFASPLAAVRCALEIQDHVGSGNSPLRLRVGLNLGDVIVGQDGELYGDGINIAVRLEGVADRGGILISEKVYNEVEGKLDVGFEDRGQQHLKNISKPVRAYAVCSGGHSAPTERLSAAPPLPDKPSIAVLPFENMSGDPGQDYFADGMVEDIITALSRFRELFVIARNSSFTYKGRAVDVKQVGRELGVRYVLEGSVRKAGNRVRISSQLVDTTTGAHIWADRFDATLEDIFDLQDQLSTMIVGAISPKVEQAEIERARRKPTESLHAYDYYLRGMASFHHGSKKSLAQALELFKKAIQLDPGFASASAMAAWCYSLRPQWTACREEAREAEAERLARLAARLGTDDATALCIAGFVLADIAGDFDTGTALASRALALNPNLITAWFLGGWVQVINGEPDAAIERFAHAERLSPFDPFIWAVRAGIAQAHFEAGRDDQALSAAEHCLRDMPNYLPALFVVAASSALTGATDRARKATARIRELSPGLCITEIEKLMARSRWKHFARLTEGLRKAGLPE
jgi:adenylate cyclase